MEHADPRPYYETLLAASKRRLHPGAPLGMLRGELGGRHFDQTRTHGTRQAIPFDRLWGTWGGGGVDMDLMATDTSAPYTPTEGGWERQKLPFYPRFHTNNTAGVDVFNHNVRYMPGSLLFPTTVLGGSSVGAHK